MWTATPQNILIWSPVCTSIVVVIVIVVVVIVVIVVTSPILSMVCVNGNMWTATPQKILIWSPVCTSSISKDTIGFVNYILLF